MESVEWGCKTLQPVLTFDAIDFLTLPCEVGTWAVPSRHGEERDAAAVVAMGVFDGLHLGHRSLLDAAKDDARANGTSLVVVTFDPDPADVLASSPYARHLLSSDDRVGGLLSLGVDAVLVMRFTSGLASLAPEAFVHDVLMREVRPLAVHVGENFKFGSMGSGTTQTLGELGRANGFAVRVHKLVQGEGDTVGGIVSCVVTGCPVGLGEPIFGKLQASLAAAMMSINAAKGFDYGAGFEGLTQRGSEQNDLFVPDGQGGITTQTNRSGGIQGGISNGQDIYFRVAFKPVATLLREQATVGTDGQPTTLRARGRHDACVLPRAVPVVEAMAAIVLLDALLLSKTTRI